MADPTFSEQIKSAIAAHSMWKAELDSAIATGKSTHNPATVKKDDQCNFGKWVHDKVDIQHKQGESFSKVKDLHQKFHDAAANVLTMALAGKKDEARKAMGQGTAFGEASANLTRAMMEWNKKA
jgi:hypothetical protein